MEKIKQVGKDNRKKGKQKSSLRRSFILAVLYTVVVVVLLSGITIWGCLRFRKWLLPDSNEVNLNITKTFDNGTESSISIVMGFGKETEEEVEAGNEKQTAEADKGEEQSKKKSTKGTDVKIFKDENDDFSVVFKLLPDEITENANGEKEPNEKNIKYSVDKVENSYEALSPRRKMAYTGASVAMVGLPLLYSVVGILLCGFWFYKKKLKKPIAILADATENIARQDLDFSVEYHSKDEMGMLCDSFEEMRQALYENNKELWRMLEERKILQASVAHDLRNPIAIIEGYAEYLQLKLSEGSLEQHEIMHIVDNLAESAKRLERYTNSMRDINKLEELEINVLDCDLQLVLHEISDDFTVMAEKNHIELQVSNTVPKMNVKIDAQILYRILENIFSNALRFAKETIHIDFSLENYLLITKIWDDGIGFSEQMLKMKNRYVPSMDKSGEHMGMGMVISNILCKKHGGKLQIKNREQGGAHVTVTIKIE